MSDQDYTTIAVKEEEEKAAMDAINRRRFDGKASYREIINFLIEEYETERDSLEEVMALAISRVDDDDIERVVRRTRNDAEWVAQLNGEDESTDE